MGRMAGSARYHSATQLYSKSKAKKRARREPGRAFYNSTGSDICLEDFFRPVFQDLLHLLRELIGKRAVNQTMIESECKMRD